MIPDEVRLQCAVTGIRDARTHLNQLQSTDYDSALNKARHHLHEAIHAIDEWATVNGFEGV